MSRALLDFASRPQRPTLWSWLLLLAGILAALLAAGEYRAVVAEREQARSRLAALEQALRPRVAGKSAASARPDARVQARERLDASARRQLDLPWADLVDRLQRTRPQDVAFLALNADGRRGDFQIQAEARGQQAMLAYLRRLQGADTLRDVALTQHETVDSDGISAVRFSLRGAWGQGADAFPAPGPAGGAP